MKPLARRIVAAILWWQVSRLRKKNDFKIVAVAGSVGKTSTKIAIAKVLAQKYKVQFQDGNYNDLVTVPLIFFGSAEPGLFNPLAWLATFIKNEKRLRQAYPYEIVVVETGSDQPGDLAEFKHRLKAEIGVLSGIAPEHMEMFKTMEAVAEEELTLADFSSLVIANKDLVGNDYLAQRDFLTYSLSAPADYQLVNTRFDNEGSNFDILAGGTKLLSARHDSISEPQLYFALAAVAVAEKLGLSPAEIEAGLEQIKPVAGRMQTLPGINGSTIIDDTYNASPEAVKAALLTLYRLQASQKIALLGNMNELGDYSEQAHREVGQLCDPKQLDMVVTLGPDANKFIAEEAKAKGCRVESCNTPYEAANFIKSNLQQGGLILAKGSQNGVFAEEAVKQLLANPSDAARLVRQSPKWMKIKNRMFGRG